MRVSCSRPNTGTVADIMHSVHKQYHFAVKSFEHSPTVLRYSKIAEANINKPPNILWSEVKRANAKIACLHVVNSVNGHSIPKDIADDFKDMYA